MESDTEENPDEHTYILSLLRNVKSPNRFAKNHLTCPSVISERTDISTVDDDSNTSDSLSSLSSSSELSDQQLVENFNQVKTGHKLDDYILAILNSGRCSKKSNNIRDNGNVSKLFYCTDLAIGKGENIASPGSVEVSEILSRPGLTRHKLDEVLQKARKIVKQPVKKRTNTAAKLFYSGDSRKSSSVRTDEQTGESATANFTCTECNFAFYSEESRNRHMSSEHTMRITRMRNCRKHRKSSNNLQNCSLQKSTSTSCYSGENDNTVSISSAVVDSNAFAKMGDQLLQELKDGEFKYLHTANNKSVNKCMSFSASPPSKRVRISNGIGNEEQCCWTKPFSEQMRPLLDRHSTRDDRNISMVVSSSMDHSSTNQSSFSLHLSSFSGLMQQPPPPPPQSSSSSSSNLESPAVLIPHNVLKEKHWIILDMPDIFNKSYASFSNFNLVKENLARNNETFGIKSIIDDSNKTSCVTQHFDAFQENSNASQDTICFNGDSEKYGDTCNTNNQVKNSLINMEHSTFTAVKESDLSNVLDNYTESSVYEAELNQDVLCARHVSFTEFINKYYHFKTLTAKSASVSPKKQKECSMNSEQIDETSKRRGHFSPGTRDYILSPPKKRWQCYVADDY
ncbi:uncharacterized protein LOC111123582 [Crassostrea virginica]